VLVLTQLMNLVFVPWLGHAGLALSIGVAALVNAAVAAASACARGLYHARARLAGLRAARAAGLPAAGRVPGLGRAGIDWIGLHASAVAARRPCWPPADRGHRAVLRLPAGHRAATSQFLRRG
jgi:peptidoglycan biosynthesis protein MviN/MurJ (putative lipid II flippase)